MQFAEHLLHGGVYDEYDEIEGDFADLVIESNDHVSMDGNAIQHGPAANGAGPRTPFANYDDDSEEDDKYTPFAELDSEEDARDYFGDLNYESVNQANQPDEDDEEEVLAEEDSEEEVPAEEDSDDDSNYDSVNQVNQVNEADEDDEEPPWVKELISNPPKDWPPQVPFDPYGVTDGDLDIGKPPILFYDSNGRISFNTYMRDIYPYTPEYPPIIDKSAYEKRPDSYGGYGLFATKEIPKGTTVIYMEGQCSLKYHQCMLRAYALKLFRERDSEGQAIYDDTFFTVEGKSKAFMDLYFLDWAHAPLWYYLNHAHSSVASLKMTMCDEWLVWQAKRDISAGDALTFPYGHPKNEWDVTSGITTRLTDISADNIVYSKRRRTVESNSHVSMHSEAVEHGDDANGAGPHTSFAEQPDDTEEVEEYLQSLRSSDALSEYTPPVNLPRVEDTRSPRERLKHHLFMYRVLRLTTRAKALLIRRWNAAKYPARARATRVSRAVILRRAKHARETRQHARKARQHKAEERKERQARRAADHVRAVGDDHAFEAVGKRWVTDSGCSVHCVPSVADLTTVLTQGSDRPLKVADKRRVQVAYTGTIAVAVKAVAPDGSPVDDVLRLSRVLVVPSFRNRLFSCSAARASDGMRTVLDGEGGQPGYIELPSRNRIYFDSDKYEFNVANQVDNSSEVTGLLAHRRLAHFSSKRLNESGIRGDHDPLTCPACCLNMKRKSFPSRAKAQRQAPPRAIRFGQRVNSDTLAMPASSEGYLYIAVFVDEASSEPAVRFLKSHTAAAMLEALRSYVAEYAHMMDGGRVAVWHTDNGGEFESSEIDAFCNAMSTHQTRSPAHTPELNGKSERFNGILVRGIRILLAESNLSECLWPYAASHVCNIHKRLVSRALNPPMSPYESNRNRKPRFTTRRAPPRSHAWWRPRSQKKNLEKIKK